MKRRATQTVAEALSRRQRQAEQTQQPKPTQGTKLQQAAQQLTDRRANKNA